MIVFLWNAEHYQTQLFVSLQFSIKISRSPFLLESIDQGSLVLIVKVGSNGVDPRINGESQNAIHSRNIRALKTEQGSAAVALVVGDLRLIEFDFMRSSTFGQVKANF